MLIAVVRNPRSGSACDRAALEQALRAAGVGAQVLDIPNGPGFTEWIDRVSDNHDVIAAAGGDGTVSSVAAAVTRANKTLAVIPTGTLNHFARDAGIPTELDAAMRLLHTGVTSAVDVGFVNGHFFLNNVSIGSYPRMVHERTALERGGKSRRLAGLVATASTWWRLRHVTARITIDGRELVRRSPFILVANGSYDLSGLELTRRHNISDHRLSLYVAPNAGRLGVLSLPLRALLGRLQRYEQFETLSAGQITMALKHSRVAAGIDGEILNLESPLQFEVKTGALKVLLSPS